MQELRLQITAADIEGARQYGLTNPILYALVQTTGTLWRMSECGVVLEVTPPYRVFLLPPEALSYRSVESANRLKLPVVFIVECHLCKEPQ